MPVEIGLKLLFGSVSIGYKFPTRPERQLANIAIRGARSAPDKSDNDELAVQHRAIMAGHQCGVKCTRPFREAVILLLFPG